MHRRFAICSWLPFVMAPLMEDPDKGGGGGGDDKKKPKKLTDLLKDDADLQDQLDEMIENRLQRDRRRRQIDGTTKEEREELERLREENRNRETKDLEAKKEYEKALGLEKEKWGTKEKNYSERLDKVTNELKKDRVRSKLVSAAAKAGAIDPEEIADLLERRITFNSETFEIGVLKEDGKSPLLNSEGNDATIEDLVGSFAGKKAHLFKGNEDGEPAGAGGGKSRNTGDQGKDKAAKGVDALLKAFDDAKAAATKSPTPANLTIMQQRKRAYETAKAAATK